MERSCVKLLITAGVILFTSILLLSSNVLAVTAEEPFLDFVGSFDYIDGSGGSPSSKYLLTFFNWNITGGNYIDGSYFGEYDDEDDDSISNAWFEIDNLYNDDYSDNLIFGNTNNSGSGAGGSTGPVSFTITDGTTIYFSATLDNFIVTDSMFGTALNPSWELNNITDPTFNDNGSQYIQELETRYNNGYSINFGMDFAFNDGSSRGGFAFSDDASGSISGKMTVTPEPISSVLFITGGATLAIRRYWKRRKKSPLS